MFVSILFCIHDEKSILSDISQKQAYYNTVVYQIVKNGPGGIIIWTHDLSL